MERAFRSSGNSVEMGAAGHDNDDNEYMRERSDSYTPWNGNKMLCFQLRTAGHKADPQAKSKFVIAQSLLTTHAHTSVLLAMGCQSEEPQSHQFWL